VINNKKEALREVLVYIKREVKVWKLLLYDFSFLPAQVFALALSAFECGFSVACAAVSTDFHV
jgi:hypothetical protein